MFLCPLSLVLPAPPAHRAVPEHPANQGLRVSPESRVQRVRQAEQELRVQRVPRVQRVFLERKVQSARRALLAQQALMASVHQSPVFQAPRVPLAQREKWDHRVQPVHKAPQSFCRTEHSILK